ncbi:MAG: PQQ-binding-like beta-propeller repeat protein [Vicinamibacterales bacterium]
MLRDRTTTYRGIRPTFAATAVFIAALVALGGAQNPRPDEEFVERIVALDPRWTVSFDTAPSAPAGFDQEMGYVPVKGGDLIAIDLNQGTVKWKVPLATVFPPATGDGLVFAASEALVTALEQRTGHTLWRTPLQSPIAGPLFWDAGWLLASTEAGDLVALVGQDGRLAWRTPLQSPLAVSPTTSDDRVYVALRDGRIVALDLEGGAVVWSHALEAAVTGMLALDDQLLVGTRDNRLHSMSLTRGRVSWSQRAGADVAGVPLADDDLIYFAAFDNVIRALDRSNGNLKWLRHLPSRPAGGPLRTENVVLVPLVTTDIGAFDAATGAPLFTIRAVGELGGVPFLRENPRPTAPRLVAMSREGALQGFAVRVEPPLAPLKELPGTAVKGGH